MMERDLLTETVESISNNFINGNLPTCKRQIQELGKEYPMMLCYVVLQLNTLAGDNFIRWVSKNLED